MDGLLKIGLKIIEISMTYDDSLSSLELNFKDEQFIMSDHIKEILQKVFDTEIDFNLE